MSKTLSHSLASSGEFTNSPILHLVVLCCPGAEHVEMAGTYAEEDTEMQLAGLTRL